MGGTCEDEVGASGEGVDGGCFVLDGLVAVPWVLLVSVCGFAVDIEVEGSIWLAKDGEVQHGYLAIGFSLWRPFDAGVDCVDVVKEVVDVVPVDVGEDVVSLAEPKLDDAGGGDGDGVVVEVAVGGEGIFSLLWCSLNLTHMALSVSPM
jgi:hypothetical protein